jgi:ABC-type multidrug transport system ATPase subunit
MDDNECQVIDNEKGSDDTCISLQNLSISIKSSQKPILYPVTVDISRGSLFCILGGSGSGKTTLLNVIAGRYSSNSVLVDGRVVFNRHSHVGVGYVTQTDFLLPYLTVRETVEFAANLRIAKQALNKSKDDIIDQTILDLGLKECSDTRITNVSGGQKRRVSIAIQVCLNSDVTLEDSSLCNPCPLDHIESGNFMC